MIGTIWWLVLWFAFVKSDTDDNFLRVNGEDKIPLLWEFYMLFDGGQGWMAAGYVSNFIAYFFVSVLELIAWIIFMVNGDGYMLNLMADWFYYCFILYLPAWIFPMFHLYLPIKDGGLANPYPQVPYQSNDVFLFVTGLAMWAYIGIIHLIYTKPLKEHLVAISTDCKCNPWAPTVDEVGIKAKEFIEKVAKEACLAMCPPEAELARMAAAEAKQSAIDQFKAS